MLRLLCAFVVSLVGIQLMGCATILQPGPDRIVIQSKPKGAKVYLNDSPVGLSPVEIACERNHDCRIAVKKEGYDDFSLDRRKVAAGWVFGNLVLLPGAPVGVIVDLIANNLGKYSSDPVTAELVSKNQEFNSKTATDPSTSSAEGKRAYDCAVIGLWKELESGNTQLRKSMNTGQIAEVYLYTSSIRGNLGDLGKLNCQNLDPSDLHDGTMRLNLHLKQAK